MAPSEANMVQFFEPHDIPEAVLRPCGWRVLVRMPEKKTKTEGGIFVPDNTADREQLAAMVAEVVALGPLCYSGEKFAASRPWCRVGDWVIFRSYTGTRFFFSGREYRLLNDDAIEGVTAFPEDVEK